jgi:hypothetical protein
MTRIAIPEDMFRSGFLCEQRNVKIRRQNQYLRNFRGVSPEVAEDNYDLYTSEMLRSR